VPSAWGAAGGGKIRPASGEDRAGIERLHRAQIERRCGGILRPVALWDRKFVGDRLEWFVLDEGQAVTGYVGLSRDQSERGAPVSMSIEDLAAENDQGRLRLLSFVSAQRDQVERVRMSVPVGDPLAIALADGGGILAVTPRSERPVGTLCAGPMVRMADVGRALGSRGYAADGDIELRLPDGPHHVSVKNRRAELGRQGEAPWIELEPTALASILYGSLLPSSAVSLGWVRGTPAAIERADALFRAPAFFSEDSF
jgi:predicted acetyltransferase